MWNSLNRNFGILSLNWYRGQLTFKSNLEVCATYFMSIGIGPEDIGEYLFENDKAGDNFTETSSQTIDRITICCLHKVLASNMSLPFTQHYSRKLM